MLARTETTSVPKPAAAKEKPADVTEAAAQGAWPVCYAVFSAT